MTCDEFLEMAAAYTLGILDEADRAACLTHLAEASHHKCLEAVAEAGEVSAKLAVTLPNPPPAPEVWRAIESRISGGGTMSAGGTVTPGQGVPPTGVPRTMMNPRVWRELAGWFVAAAVVGFHLYNVPVDPQRQAAAGPRVRPGLGDSEQAAMALMVAPGTRLSTFSAQREGIGPASVMLNVGEKRAVVVARAGRVSGPEGLRLWTVRGQLPPASLGTLLPSGADAELASVSVGSALFEPSLGDKLLISVDTPEASAPQAVLLQASLH